MSDGDEILQKSSAEELMEYLEANPKEYDVTFLVGQEKTVVKALKILLKSASPTFKKEFESNASWKKALAKRGKVHGIELPEFDPGAFQLFIKLLTLGLWSVEVLQKLKLSFNELLNFYAVCVRFGSETAVKNSQKLVMECIESLSKLKDTDEFLGLSQANLTALISSDGIQLSEPEVFECVSRWAEFHCRRKGLKFTGANMRMILGHCLFEIRFPLMQNTDFTQIVGAHENLLTQAEAFQIYKYIGCGVDKSFDVDPTQFRFKTKGRHVNRRALKSEFKKPIPADTLSLSLTKGCPIVESPPFVCDGECNNYLHVTVGTKVAIHGLGFLGPIEGDSFYDVGIEIINRVNGQETFFGRRKEKQIFSHKGQVFYFVFDEPVIFEPETEKKWENSYDICFSIAGPNTSSVLRKEGLMSTVLEKSVEFNFHWVTKQLASILFQKV